MVIAKVELVSIFILAHGFFKKLIMETLLQSELVQWEQHLFILV